MVSTEKRHPVKWFAPMPLWAERSSLGIHPREHAREREPAILRFASDTFMDDLLNVVTSSPTGISEFIAQPETWRQPMVSPKPRVKPEPDSVISHLFKKTRLLTQQQIPGKKQFSKTVDTPAADSAAEHDNGDRPPLKLFQAGHQRYYLVSATLSSGEPNYSDCALDLGRNERATFVVRRLAPPSDELTGAPIEEWRDIADEYAFVITPGGAEWRKIDTHKSEVTRRLVPREEQLPLFPLIYEDRCGHKRHIHSGLIPVGKREVWMGAPAGVAPAGQSPQNQSPAEQGSTSLKMSIFQNDVAGPWKALIQHAQLTSDRVGESLGPIYGNFGIKSEDANNEASLQTARDQIQTGSWYVLLDFAKFLENNLMNVWAEINNVQPADPLLDDEVSLIDHLASTVISASLRSSLTSKRYSEADVKNNMLEALADIAGFENDLEFIEKEFVRDDPASETERSWPDFLFPLADPYPMDSVLVPNTDIDESAFSALGKEEIEQAKTLAKIDALAALIDKILSTSSKETEVPEEENLISSQTVLDQREAWFVVRCVYERPGCGPLFPAVVSEPTRLFQMAPFFDPDAPARPVRIPMPVDISPAGLRKFKKTASFVMSDMLCGQIKRIRKLTLGDLVLSVLPWPFHKDLPDPGKTGPCKGGGGINIGMICSLSIPIVTLCAFIMLIIIVALFDLFFKWIPYFFICLPIPGLKAKKK
jgi:hypothetical protein